MGEANRFLVERAPWKLAGEPGRRGELGAVLYAAAEVLRIVALLAAPVMPGAAARLWQQLGIASPLETQRLPEAAAWGGLPPGTVTSKGDALFPRLSS